MKVDGNEVSLLYQQVSVCGEVYGAGMLKKYFVDRMLSSIKFEIICRYCLLGTTKNSNHASIP